MKLFPYQKEGVIRLAQLNGIGFLCDSPGLGKTGQSINYWKLYVRELPVIIVCPAVVKWNWAKEFKIWANVNSTVLSGGKPYRLPKNSIYIINYDILKSWKEELIELGAELIVFDEGHYLTNRNAKRTKAATEIAEGIPRRIIMTGTPISNRFAELYAQLHILWPEEFDNWFEYSCRYCPPTRTPWGIQYNRSINGNELRKKILDLGFIRRTQKEVLKDLPPQITSVVPVEIPNKKDYQTADSMFKEWALRNRGSKHYKILFRSKLQTLLGIISDSKTKLVKEWVEDFLQETDEKLIVFGTRIAFVDGLYNIFKDVSVKINGSIPTSKRQPIIDQFQTDPKCRIMFANLRAAGAGWNGTAATYVLMGEFDPNPAVMAQAAGRINRIGQTRTNYCYYLVGKDTMEERIVKAWEEKQKKIDQVLDGEEGDFQIQDLLEESLLTN